MKPFYCGKIGHIGKNCHKKRLDETQHRHKRHVGHFADGDHNQDLRLFMVDSDENDEASTWFLDSRASTHMTGNRQWFENFKETSSGSKIYLGDDRGYQIKRYGNLHVIFPNGNIRHIQNEMYVPGIKNNLISVSMITNQNLKVDFFKYYCVIKDLLYRMKPIALGIRVGGLYKLNVRSVPHQDLTSSVMTA